MKLKELRESHGLYQKDVAAVLHTSTPVYSRYETGDREPPFAVLLTLADYYGVSIDYILGRDQEEHTQDDVEIRVLTRGGKQLTPEQIKKRNELIARLWEMDDEELDQAGQVIDIYRKR